MTAKDDSFKNTISILFYDTKLGGKKESKNCTASLGARYQMIMPEEKNHCFRWQNTQMHSCIPLDYLPRQWKIGDF